MFLHTCKFSEVNLNNNNNNQNWEECNDGLIFIDFSSRFWHHWESGSNGSLINIRTDHLSGIFSNWSSDVGAQ